MSLFTKVKEEPAMQEAAAGRTALRYEHLVKYAELLELDADLVTDLYQQAGLNDDVSEEALNRFQYLINLESYRKDILGDKPAEPAKIDSVDMLDWYFKKIGGLNSELSAVKAQFKKEIGRIESQINSFEYLYKQAAEAFGKALCEQEGKKTVNLKHGTVAIRTEKPSWKLGNEDELQTWLRFLPDGDKEYFGVQPKTFTRNLDLLKNAAAQKPGTIPGLVYSPGGDNVSLRLPKED